MQAEQTKPSMSLHLIASSTLRQF